MISLLPSYICGIKLETTNAGKSLENIKNRFQTKGGQILNEDSDFVELQIPASNLAAGVSFFPNTLCIHISKTSSTNVIDVQIERRGEKKAGILFLVIVSLIGLGSYFQKQDATVFFGQIFFFFIFWLYSFIPAHPAHKVIRDLLRFTDESVEI